MPWDRPGLEKLLDVALRPRISMVISTAGWGKTTALRSWTRHHRSVWLRADGRTDAAGIVRALHEVGAAGATRPPDGLGRAVHGAEQLAAAAAEVCAWLRSAVQDELFVVVDDVERLAPGSEAVRFVEGLCWHVPEPVHLVLLSRREPPFSLSRLRGQRMLSDITAPQLAFDASEVELLLQDVLGSRAAEVSEEVMERTGGWPAAVAAVAEALYGADEPRVALERPTQPGEWFHTYLREQVVGPEPEWVQDLLRRTAVLGEIATPARLGVDAHDPELVLADLTRRGLLQRSPGERRRWRLVPPLADYFAQETVLPPAKRAALHAAAASECVERGAYAEALQHLLAAGERGRAASLLADHGRALVSGGAADIVLQAAELAPEHLNDNRLQQVLGEARQLRGQWAAAFDAYQRAGRGQERLEPSLAWRIVFMLQMQGELLEIPPILDRVVMGREDTTDEAWLLGQVATASRLVGDFANAQKLAARSMAAARRSGRASAYGPVHNVYAMLAAAEGDRRRVDAHFESALRSAETDNDVIHILWVRTSRAFHTFDTLSPQEAAREARELRELTRTAQIPFLTAHVLNISGRADVRLGALDSAATDLAAAIDHFQRLASRYLAWPLISLGDLYRVKGQQLMRARAVYEEALDLAEPAHDAIGMASALSGLARVRAADDLEAARTLAERAVAVGEPLREIGAYLTRGWVALLSGDRRSASVDAARAGAAARRRRDDLGLAEAITLTVMSSDAPETEAGLLEEAAQIFRDEGCRLEEAAVRMVAGRIGGEAAQLDADRAGQVLRAAGVDVEGRRAAGPLAVLARSAPTVTIRALGTFQVLRGRQPVPKSDWQSKKARELVKILVARRRPVPRERLLDLLWPDAATAKSTNRLSVLLSMARDVLQPGRAESGPIMSDGTTIWLDHSRVAVDVEDFLRRADIALAAHRRGQRDAADLLAAALAVHAGGFLEDDPYQEWAVPLAEEVRAAYIALLRALVSRLRAAGDVDEAIRYGLRLLEEDAYDEEVRLDLVSALMEAGRLGEARRQYEIYAHRMREIDVDPQPMPRPGRRRRPADPG